MSPIEKSFLSAFRATVPNEWTLWDHVDLDRDGSPNSIGGGDEHMQIFAGKSISTYKCDFFIVTDSGASLAIECDGHDFHDRTKQQAAYDRSRDRELLTMGIPTIRFTGSEIVHSPERCAAEAYGVINKLNDQRWDLCREWSTGHNAGAAWAIKEMGLRTASDMTSPGAP